MPAPGTNKAPGQRRSTVSPHAKAPKVRKTQLKKTLTGIQAAAHASAIHHSSILLSVFAQTFPTVLANKNLETLLQTVKGHLFDRNYAEAFSTAEFLETYVVRWSPSRALAYRAAFLELDEALADCFRIEGGMRKEVVCIGGGAGAELVAAAAAGRFLLPKETVGGEGKLHVTAIDSADWSGVTKALVGTLNDVYLPRNQYTADFHHADILEPDNMALIPETADLITLLFTTNELYTQSRAGTTRFLLSLAARVQKGCLLMVLESAGSYSTVQIGDKTFSMGLLLEHTLLGNNGGVDWEIVVSEDSKWYRLPDGADEAYPLQLENMRYFVRVFRRL